MSRSARAGLFLTFAGLATAGCAPTDVVPAAVADYASARFSDPDRVTRLRTALPEIDSLFKAFAKNSRVPGIAYGVLIDGQLVHTGTAGMRDLANNAPVDSASVFRIASMTKSFTALSILKLRDEGKLALDDPAELYIPELAGLAYPTTDSPRLTIRNLLSHSAGFPEDNPWGDQQLDRTDDEMGQMMRSGLPFSNPPGIAYEYSNYGFAMLGRIVSRVSGRPYATYVRENILEPLGMTSTTMEAAQVPPERLARGYRWEDERWKDEPPLPDGAFGAMGGMLTSIDDLGRWVGFLMSAWPPRSDPEEGPVRRASVREMQELWRSRPSRVTVSGRDSVIELSSGGYGFGLGITQNCEFGHVVAHSGGLPGYGSQMRWLPAHGVGIIALGNLTYTGWGGVITQALDAMSRTDALQPREPSPSAALASARDAVSRLVVSWNDQLADSLAAMNLYLDEAKDRRQRAITALLADVGRCRNDGPFAVENALRGQWMMTCDRGALRVAITLAPTIPPKVQYLSVRRADPGESLAAPAVCPSGTDR
jgi:CubicO group peptidase (beta-lactamase class C family)